MLSVASVAFACSSSPLAVPSANGGAAGTDGGAAAGKGGQNTDISSGGSSLGTPGAGPHAGRGGAGAGGRALTGGEAGAVEAAGAPEEGGAAGASTVVHVFERIPQFGIYVDSDPQNYTPHDGVVLWSHGTEYVAKLSELQQSQLGSDLAVRISYFAQCDEYDRLGGIFLILKPKGQKPEPSDPRIELVRFITPFSDYKQGALAKHVYPDADISAYASVLADSSRDVWIGIAGGSNPYRGDACTEASGALRAGVTAEFARVGFRYSVDLVSTQPLVGGPSFVLTAISKTEETTVPVAGTFSNGAETVSGHVTVVVSGHGSAAGGVEYQHTEDTVSLNGDVIGSFSTEIDCAPYAKFSPRGNPGIFKNNAASNPRNWCPGALVPSQTFEATLAAGDNSVRLDIDPSDVPEGSYYSTSITFSSP